MSRQLRKNYLDSALEQPPDSTTNPPHRSATFKLLQDVRDRRQGPYRTPREKVPVRQLRSRVGTAPLKIKIRKRALISKRPTTTQIEIQLLLGFFANAQASFLQRHLIRRSQDRPGPARPMCYTPGSFNFEYFTKTVRSSGLNMASCDLQKAQMGVLAGGRQISSAFCCLRI